VDRRNNIPFEGLTRGLLIIAAALCIPLVPFFIIGEIPGERWLSATDEHAGLFALVGAGLLIIDIFLPVPSSIVGTMLGARLGFVAGFLATFALKPAESVTFAGAGGTPVQAWIVKPNTFKEGEKYPLLYLVHGGPQSAWNDGWTYRWNAQVFASAGYVVFMPNPRGSTGFGQRFTDDISNDWGGKPFDDLMKGVDYAEKLPYVDAARKVAAGASYGGYMMNWFLGHTDRFKAIVSHAGCST
jgi:poly(3-hydroxybutyrate) depolymerase